MKREFIRKNTWPGCVAATVLFLWIGAVAPLKADFINGGFELGNFTGWILEYRNLNSGGAWSSARPPGHPAPAINPTVNFLGLSFPAFCGGQTASINDVNGSYHATRISQTTRLTADDIVESSCGQTTGVRVEWMAVLEEPPNRHPPDQQPRFSIDVSVNGVSVRSFQANALDAGMPGSGWTSAGGNFWQRRGVFELLIPNAAVGDTVRVVMTVQDCGWGGHGGMAFIDCAEITPPTGGFLPPQTWATAGIGDDDWYVGDFNGDGRDDIARWQGAVGVEVLLSNGTGFDAPAVWTQAGIGGRDWYVGDFDGDGLEDIARWQNAVGIEVFLSTGSGFVGPQTWTQAGIGDANWYVGDFNGDGYDDIARWQGAIGIEVFLSTGSGFLGPLLWSKAGIGDRDWYVGDFDGDGLDDIARWQGAVGVEVLLAVRSGFGPGVAFSAPIRWTGAGIGDRNWYVGNFKCDARDDMMRWQGWTGPQVLASSGVNFEPPSEWSPDGIGDRDWYVGDFDGDGADDLARWQGDVGVEVLRACNIEACTPPCARVRPIGRPLCALDGSGSFTYPFHFTNLTGDPIHHLFIDPKSPGSGATVAPNYINLSASPVPPGGSRLITLTIDAADPNKTLILLASIHDQRLNMCCSFDIRLDPPACDCLQIPSLVSCWQFLPQTTPPYPFRMILSNLSPTPVHNILLTPIAPANVVYSPNRFSILSGLFAPLLTGDTSLPLYFKIDGPGTAPGGTARFLVSIHDRLFQQCCSGKEVAVTLPRRCGNIPFSVLGGAFAEAFEDGLALNNIGSSGQDGIRFHLEDASGIELSWQDLDPADALPPGAGLSLDLSGSFGDNRDNSLGGLSVEKTQEGLRVTPSSGESRMLTIIDRDGLVAGTGVVNQVQAVGGNGLVIWPVAMSADLLSAGLDLELAWPELVRFTWDGGSATGDRLRLGLPTEDAMPEGLSGLTATVIDIPVIRYNGILPSFDCNRNGVADRFDIEAGVSADVNGDGIPDECQAPADLEIVLNTGFDQEIGELIPLDPDGDRSDDDWILANAEPPAPAQVVARPISAWPEPFPDSRWISIEPERGVSPSPQSTTVYETSFCLAEEAHLIRLELQLLADDRAAVLLNGEPISETGGAFNGQPLVINYADNSSDSLFQTGANRLQIVVEDTFGVRTGLVVEGKVTAKSAACDFQP